MNTRSPTDILRAVARRVLTENQRRILRRFLERLRSRPFKKASTDALRAARPDVAQVIAPRPNVAIERAAYEENLPVIDLRGPRWLATNAVIHERKFAKVAGPRKLISVIYNYYMKSSTILTSLERLRQQKLSRCSADDIEIILVDDGSEGEDLLEKLPDEVTYLWQRKYGYGIARAKNTGAKISNGRYLIFLDPDILIHEEYIDAMLDGFATYGDEIVQCGYIWDYHFQGCPDPRVEFGVWENPNRPTRRFYQIAGGNMAIAREMFQHTPGFDEDLIYGGVEDLLFGYQYGKLPGAAVYFNKKMEAWHIPHPPSPAHADPAKSWNVVRVKHPEFYDAYFVKGLR